MSMCDEVKKEYIANILNIEKEHIKKYGLKHQSIENLRKEIENSEDKELKEMIKSARNNNKLLSEKEMSKYGLKL